MTKAGSGDTLTLVNAGTASAGENWRGGCGVIYCNIAGSISGAALEQQVGSAWVPCKDVNGTAITFSAIGMFNFELPAGPLRMSGTVTGATVIVVGV